MLLSPKALVIASSPCSKTGVSPIPNGSGLRTQTVPGVRTVTMNVIVAFLFSFVTLIFPSAKCGILFV